MTTAEILADKVANLEQARQQTVTNRDRWTTVLKPFLVAQLTQIKEAFPIGWSLDQGDSARTNQDYVTLSFDNTDSGIISIQTSQAVVKQGGGVFFGQSLNGKIVILIVYPAVQNFAKASPPKQIGTVDPIEIDATFVARVLVQFLEEMTKWEENGERPLPQIGFQNHDF